MAAPYTPPLPPDTSSKYLGKAKNSDVHLFIQGTGGHSDPSREFDALLAEATTQGKYAPGQPAMFVGYAAVQFRNTNTATADTLASLFVDHVTWLFVQFERIHASPEGIDMAGLEILLERV
jgi:hypothetical protein